MGRLGRRVDALAVAVEALTPTERPTSAWRAVRLWAYVLAIAAVAGMMTLVGTKAFTDVHTIPDDDGAVVVNVGLEQQGRVLNSRIMILAYERYDAGSNTVTYRFFFPAGLAGEPFLIILSGTAQVDDPTFSTGMRIGKPFCNETAFLGPPLGCQVFEGVLPSSLAATSPTKPPNCATNPESFNAVFSLLKAGSFSITGAARFAKSIDLFHTALSLPMIEGEQWQVDKAGYAPGHAGYVSAPVTPCRELIIEADTEVSDFYGTPDYSAEDHHYWSVAGSGEPAGVIVQRRSAQRWGNMSIAVAGAAFGLSVGFTPLAYEAVGAWRRQRRRVKAR